MDRYRNLMSEIAALHEEVMRENAAMKSEIGSLKEAAARAPNTCNSLAQYCSEGNLWDSDDRQHSKGLAVRRSQSSLSGNRCQSKVFNDLSQIPSVSTSMSPAIKDIKLWPAWQDDQDEDERLGSKIIIDDAPTSESQMQDGHVRSSGSWLRNIMLTPNCRARICWDVLSVLVLSYDILTVPMVAFEHSDESDSTAKQVLDVLATLFWTLDIPITFLSGYHDGTVLEMRPSKISSRYLRGWFLFDFPVLMVDWAIMLLIHGDIGNVIGMARVSKVLRVTRALRLFRLIRILKWPNWADGVAERLRSEGLLTAFGVLRSLVIIIVANHFLACGWYFVGDQNRPLTWVQDLDDEGRGLSYRYASSLHWSVTQFTPASMEVVPRSTPERVYCLAVIFVAMVTFSCFISSITQAMAGLQRTSFEKAKQETNMRQYISENQISLELGHRISAFMHTHRVMAKRRVHEDDVGIFKLLPESLKLELHCEVYMPVVKIHPLFRRFRGLDDGFVEEVCHRCMKEVSLRRSEELWTPGHEAQRAFFVRAGVLEYHQSRKEDSRIRTVKGEKLLCEIALWIQWETQGRLVASMPAEFVALDGTKFRKTASRKPVILLACREYAAAFHLRALEDDPMAMEVGLLQDTAEALVEQAFSSAGSAVISLDRRPSLSLTEKLANIF